MPTNPSSVSVAVPAAPASAAVLRAVIGSFAAGLDFTYDEIDDLRLALDETFNLLMSAGGATGRVSVRLVDSDGNLEVVASGTAGGPWPPEGARRDLAWQVLDALADEASFERLDDEPAIRFVKRPATH